jgi:hypothetical protein
MVDIEQALLDPTSVFGHPKDVLSHPELTREQKIEILRRWAYDAKELEVADEENMHHETRNEDILDDILQALNELGAGLMNN